MNAWVSLYESIDQFIGIHGRVYIMLSIVNMNAWTTLYDGTD